ncbi:hypothetical protein EGW08_013080 [Elysia chlorotica]|uniref:E3 ubiquitin-protein ligase n=1 Tax=Elysia chlorotica TaxID=188477 RepID=A0A3S1BAW2_ELYCH|nr:hypothetical protein EGW08_013080 [Elysia chlorotica]
MSVIVWGRNNDYRLLTPYPPEVSNSIEEIFAANKTTFKNLGRIQLGSFSPDYANYSIDTALMKQCQTDSGRRFAVKRSTMESYSALAKGYIWEFEGDTPNHWFSYDVTTMLYLEEAYTKLMKRKSKSRKAQHVVDMSRSFMPYVIDVEKMQQTRSGIGTVRNVRRQPLTQPYKTGTLDSPSDDDQGSLSDDLAQNIPTVTRSSLKRRNVASNGATAQPTAASVAASVGQQSSAPASTQVQQPPATGAAATAVKQAPAAAATKKSLSKKRQGSGSSRKKDKAAAKEREALPTEKNIKINTKKGKKARPAEEVLQQYTTVIRVDDKNHREDDNDMDADEGTEERENHDCCICCDKLSGPSGYGEGLACADVVVQLKRCAHKFHRFCLLEMYKSTHKNESLQCPSCKLIYGEKTGTCPAGVMRWDILSGSSVAGYEGYDTISVSYDIRSGVQGPEHPKPGQAFYTQGFPRVGYLPDTDKGRKVCTFFFVFISSNLLMFTVGTSYTTGSSDVVTWNEIHHKTELYGNYSGHGYPDASYLDNVILELADHGVTEDCL